MYYNAIRIIITVLIFIVPFFLIILKRKFKRIWIPIVGFFIVLTVLSSIPFENLLFSFSSPEDALAYQYSKSANTVIEGEDSCMVYYTTAPNTYTHAFFKKDDTQYKLSHYMEGRKIAQHHSINGIWQIYHFGKTDDYYVFGTRYDSPEIRVTHDGIDVPVKLEIIGDSFVNFYLNGYTDNTVLYVNDTAIEFE